jgi:hypothetical protein
MVTRQYYLLWVIGAMLLGMFTTHPVTAGGFEDTGDWQEIKPGGLATCARGAEFSFFYRPAESDNVIIDFMGGGACWNDTTCNKLTATFTDSVDYLREMYRKGLQGIYDHSKAENPVKNWHHIVIPYCTGDLHWGNSNHAYSDAGGDPFIIQHRGAENVKAVLAWVAKHQFTPKKVLLTGCSAGSYGSIYWTPQVKEMFLSSQVMQMGDSGVGVMTPEFPRVAFPLWHPEQSGPSWIPRLDPSHTTWASLSVPKIYNIVSDYYKNVHFAQYNSIDDSTQTFFYELMGGLAWDWSPKMVKAVKNVVRKSPNFNSYIAPGLDHCVLPYDRFYTIESSGVKFRDWFADYIEGKKVKNIKCETCG